MKSKSKHATRKTAWRRSGSYRRRIGGTLQTRNTTLPVGTVNAEGRELALEQTGEFRTLADIGTVVFTQTANGTPLYLRDIGSAHRSYQHPPRLVSYYTWRDPKGHWLRGRAITLSTEMKKGRADRPLRDGGPRPSG